MVLDKPFPESQQTGPWRLLLCLVSLTVAIYALYETMLPPKVHQGWTTDVALTCLFWLGGFFLLAFLHFRSPYLFTSAYAVAVSLFHLSITIPEGLGLIHYDGWPNGSMAKWFEHAGWYTALALGCLGLGFGISLRSGISLIPSQNAYEAEKQPLSQLFWDGIGLLIVSLAMLAFAIASFGNIFEYSRADFFQGRNDTRGLGVFLITFPSALILLVIGATRFWQKGLAWIMSALGFVLIMMSGYRTSALYPLMIGGIVWVKTGRRIPVTYVTIGVIVIAFAISAIGLLRQHKYGEMDINTIEKSVESASFEHTFSGMGQTGALLGHILRLVPAQDPYTYGAGLFHYLRASVPNISFSTNESARVTATRNAINDPNVFRDLPPSDWLSHHLIPQSFLKGHGVGFTAIGEPYLNFGLGGVIAYFLLIGFLLGTLDRIDLLAHPRVLFFCSAILWHFIRTARDDLGNFIKPLVFTYLIVWLWRAAIRVFLSVRANSEHELRWPLFTSKSTN